jgi:rhodanese-related sulfurtransferase
LNRGKAAKEIDTIENHRRRVFKEVEIGESKVIDVRKDTEYSAEHVEEAFSKPLASINDWIKISILKNRFLHCAVDAV